LIFEKKLEQGEEKEGSEAIEVLRKDLQSESVAGYSVIVLIKYIRSMVVQKAMVFWSSRDMNMIPL